MRMTASFFFNSIFTLKTIGMGRTRMTTSAKTSVNWRVVRKVAKYRGSMIMVGLSSTYQKGQEHWYCLNAIVLEAQNTKSVTILFTALGVIRTVVVRLDEHRDWIARKEVGYGEADRPAHDKRQYTVYDDLESLNCEDVLVHD